MYIEMNMNIYMNKENLSFQTLEKVLAAAGECVLYTKVQLKRRVENCADAVSKGSAIAYKVYRVNLTRIRECLRFIM